MSTRRELLAVIGVGTGTLLAGCLTGSDDDNEQVQPGEARDDFDDSDTGPVQDPDVPDQIHDHLLTARGYEGSIEDRTDDDEIDVLVGAGEDGLAFEPPVIRVETGTTVRWLWTGEGGLHNVVTGSESEIQFDSGSTVDSADERFDHRFADAGIGLYSCLPHRAAGMRGAVEVVHRE